jgi:ATP sulfurylase
LTKKEIKALDSYDFSKRFTEFSDILLVSIMPFLRLILDTSKTKCVSKWQIPKRENIPLYQSLIQQEVIATIKLPKVFARPEARCHRR